MRKQAPQNTARQKLFNHYADSSLRESTKRDYQSRLNIYQSKGNKLPATPIQIAKFLETTKKHTRNKLGELKETKEYLSISSCISFISALSWWHKTNATTDPTKDKLVVAAMCAIKRKRAKQQDQARALTQKEFQSIVETLSASIEKTTNKAAKNRLIRDLAFITTLFYTGCRESEIRTLRVEDINIDEEGMSVTIMKSKKDDDAKDVPVPRKNNDGQNMPAVQAVEDWLEVAKITAGYIFRQIDNSGNTKSGKQTMSYKYSSSTITKHAKAAGVSLDKLKTHSMRASCASTLLESGVDITQIAIHLRHKTTASTMRYFRSDKNTRMKNAPTKEIRQNKEPTSLSVKILKKLKAVFT